MLERGKGAENWGRILVEEEKKRIEKLKRRSHSERERTVTVPSMEQGKFSLLICQAENCQLPW